MSLPPEIDEACVLLAEDLLAAELARTGADPETSTRVLSLATAIQEAVDRWYANHGGDGEVVS